MNKVKPIKKVHHKKYHETFLKTFCLEKLPPVQRLQLKMNIEAWLWDYAAHLTNGGDHLFEWGFYEVNGFAFYGPKNRGKYHVFNPGNGFETDVNEHVFGLILTSCAFSNLSFQAANAGMHDWCNALSLQYAKARSAAGHFSDADDVIIYRALD